RAIVGPDAGTLTTPWISNRLAVGFPVSHGPSLGPDGVGYFGDWVDNRVYKFDFTTGAVLGSFLTNHFTESVPAICASPFIVCGTDGVCFGIDTSIMDYDWFVNPNSYMGGSANVGPDGDAVWAMSNGKVYRVHPTTGASVWTMSGYGTPHGTAVFTRDDLHLVLAHDSTVAMLNYSDGSLAWSRTFPAAMYSPSTAPSGTILVGSDDGTIYGLDPANGNTLWTWSTLGQVEGAAAYSPDGTVAYVPSYDDRLYAIRVSDGTRLWSFTTSLWCVSAPAVGFDGSIYVHNKAGDLYRVSPSGSQVWQVHLNGESRGPMTIGPDGTLYVGYTGSTSGLAIIRQQALSLAPTGFSLLRGSIVSGGLAEAVADDGSYLRMKSGAGITASDSPLQAIFSGTAPYSPENKITITVKAHAATPGLLRVVYLWNAGASHWDQVQSVAETVTDSTTTMTVPNAQAYTDASGHYQAKVSWFNTGSALTATWIVSLDYIHFSMVPQFTP
ncbi:MAG TPA: PQQ-binding-like beta-propeller repeat protein, partial [Fimbriimonadaceae bacterium]|nr:PQQ-binding-like beta-propeller repeat protein [Fimbriimonadaceae bacterium]